MDSSDGIGVERSRRADFFKHPLNILLAVFFVVCASFYFWTADATNPRLVPVASNYFNLQTDAFLHHQVALLVKPDPKLLAMRDPYDLVARTKAGAKDLHDVLLYKKKYYLYWGLSPVLLLFLPVRVLTHQYVTDATAAALFASGGLLFCGLLMNLIRLDYFRSTKPWFSIAVALLLAFGNMAPFILRRPVVYEVAITCGYFVTSVFWYLIYQAAFRGSLRYRYLLAAGAALGLVFLSRPNLAVCGVAIVGAFVLHRREIGGRIRDLWKFAGFALGPAAACVAAQAYYNFIRFGSPAEYGIKFQLAGIDLRQFPVFSLSRGLYSTVFYLFNPPVFSPLFPFVQTPASGVLFGPFRWAALGLASLAPASPVEPTLGVLFAVPLLLVLVISPTFIAMRRLRLDLRIFMLALLLAGLGIGLFVGSAGATMRYELDFLPALLIVAGTLVFWLSGMIERSGGRLLFRTAVVVMAFYTVFVSAAVSITGYDNSLLVNHPHKYYALEDAFGPLEQLLAHPVRYSGTVRANATLPPCDSDIGQPLLVSGQVGEGDFLMLRCLSKPGRYAVGWNHWGTPTVMGDAFSASPGAPIAVEISAPPLIPRPHAADKPAPPSTACLVKIDARVVFKTKACKMYPTNSVSVYLFRNPIGGTVVTDQYPGKVTIQP